MNIRPYSFMIKKTNKVKMLDRFRLFLLRLILPSDFYIGVIDSNSHKRFIDKAELQNKYR